MAKNTKKKVSRIKTKRKNWFKVIAPKLFGNKEIGESYLTAAEDAVGRSLSVNLRELTGNVKDQNTHVQFRITGVKDNQLQTEPIGYKLSASYVKRLVRKNTARIDDHFILKTKSGETAILKGFVVARNRIQKSVKTEIRKQLHAALQEELAKVSFSEFVGNLVAHKVQGGLKKKLSKVYPLRDVAIRVLTLVEKKSAMGSGAVEQPAVDETPAAEEPAQEEIPVEEVAEDSEAQTAEA